MTDLPLSGELAALPAPWGSVLAAMEALSSLCDTRNTFLQAQVDQLHVEMGELRDELQTTRMFRVQSS